MAEKLIETLIEMFSLRVVGIILKKLTARLGLKGKVRDRLRQRVDVEVIGKGQIYKGYAGKPVGFDLVLDCKALFDDISVEFIRCIFFWENIPLQTMLWEKGDKWATNCTVPRVPEKLIYLGKRSMTLFLNPVPLFSLWAEMEAIDYQHISDNWGINIRIGLKSKHFGDFIIRNESHINAPEDLRDLAAKRFAYLRSYS